MEQNDLRTVLADKLNTLKCNLDFVPREVLKTKYKGGYDKLCGEISSYATAYVKTAVLSDIRIHTDFQRELVPLIQETIDRSGLLRQMSSALFGRQDLAELDRLALELKHRIQNVLEPICRRHMGIYVSMGSPQRSPQPLPYCRVNGCLLVNGTWIPVEQTGDKLLIIFSGEQTAA